MTSAAVREPAIPDVLSVKDVFLRSLRSSGDLPYKRYTASPLRYAGGKSLAVGFVVELIPAKVRRVVSPFMGGGSVEIALAKELGIDVVAYDVFDLLCLYWQMQVSRPHDLAQRLRAFTPTRTTFAEVKRRLKAHWIGQQMVTDVMELAALYYFNSNTSYGPHFLGWPSDIYLEPSRYEGVLKKVASFSAPRLSIQCAPFDISMAKHPNDFFYCDPPYYLDEGKTFVGMYPHRNFPVHHVGFNHEKLRDRLLNHKGGFCVVVQRLPHYSRLVFWLHDEGSKVAIHVWARGYPYRRKPQDFERGDAHQEVTRAADMETSSMTPRRGGTTEQAREYRQKGHDVAKKFAHLLGLPDDYRRDQKAKKDVIDPSGDAHSIKAGDKKWQVFLYGRKRVC